MSIAIVVLTHNRPHLLKQCVEHVLLRTSPSTKEIVIWDNGSSNPEEDGLDHVTDPRVTVIRHPENIGLNGYARGFALTTAEYLIEVDDDIIDAPPEWDARLLEAYRGLPDVGYLAANLVDNPRDTTAQIMYGANAKLYRYVEENGFRLKLGPVGGGCTMTDRDLHDRVGGFRTSDRAIFWQEDAEYIAKIRAIGFRSAYLDDLRVLHAGGPHYSEPAPAKTAYWDRYYRRVNRRNRVKRALLRMPLVRRLNARYAWFVPPE